MGVSNGYYPKNRFLVRFKANWTRIFFILWQNILKCLLTLAAPISLWHGRTGIQTQFLGSTCTHSTTSWLGHEFSGLLLPQCLDISTLDKINNYIFQNIFFTSKSSGWTPLILQNKKTFGFKTNKQCNCIWFYLKSLQQIQKSLNILDPIYK